MKAIVYYRVSDPKQGVSRLGLESQQHDVTEFNKGQYDIIASYTEVETGKQHKPVKIESGVDRAGKATLFLITEMNRPQLLAAIQHCQKTKAMLIIAKLDRLARDVNFISGLMKTNVPFVCVDTPIIDTFWMHMKAAFAEEEGKKISERTKAGLAAAKRRGVVLGTRDIQRMGKMNRNAAIERWNHVTETIMTMRKNGLGVRAIGRELNIKPMNVSNIIKRYSSI